MKKQYHPVKSMRVENKVWKDFKRLEQRDETDNAFIKRITKLLWESKKDS